LAKIRTECLGIFFRFAGAEKGFLLLKCKKFVIQRLSSCRVSLFLIWDKNHSTVKGLLS
jgi:hypothetical protein